MRVRFCSEQEAVSIIPSQSMALISITNPGDTAPVMDGWGKVLRIAFADATYGEREIKFFDRMWYISSQGFFTKTHAIAIRDFLDTLDQTIDLVVHCGAGQSRSVAVAMYAAEKLGVPLDGDVSRHNVTVLQLLNNPCLFDSILPATQESASLWATMKQFCNS